MKCSRCNKNNTSKIDQDGKYIYCLDCNYTFKTNVEVKSGTVEFPTGKFMDSIKKMELASPQERAVLEAGLTGEFMEQWFEGFKAGQMASIVHARKFYDGKDRNDSSRSDGVTSGGNGVTGISAGASGERIGETGINADTFAADSRSTSRVTENISGVLVSLPQPLDTDEMRLAVATLIDKAKELAINPIRNIYFSHGSALITWEPNKE